MKRILTFIFLATLGVLASCQKQDAVEEVLVKDINNLQVPSGFSWESSRDVYFELKITDMKFAKSIHVVSIYDADPELNGKLLAKGSASISADFSTKIYLPNTVKEVFVVKTAPDNSTSSQKVSVNSTKLEVQLSGVLKNSSSSLNEGKVSGLGDSPDCNTGCTQTITTNNTNLNINNGDVVCITGNNITVGFNGNGGTVRICGTNVTVQNASLNGSAKLIVTRTASVTFNNLNTNGNASEFVNYGTVAINGSFSPKGTFTNEGTLSTSSDLNLNSQTNFKNYGVLNVGATMNVNTGSDALNSGSIITGQHFELNSNNDFTNNCFIWVKGDYKHNSDMFNHGLIKVNNTTTVNGNDVINMYNGAMLLTRDLKLNGDIVGIGTTSLVKVTSLSTLNGGSAVKNALQFCDSNGIETNNTTFSGGATRACAIYIAVSNCNPEGNGNPPIVDTDGDGVNDPQDEYPTDPTKAYNNYYPSSTPASGATIAFEDQWPTKGDYDMNDVIVSYRYKVVTNSQNKVVQVQGNYSLHATGGYFRNGFAIEFPISRSSVTGLSGGTLETGQANAVVVLFTDMRAEMPNWNTILTEQESPLKDYTMTFNIINGPSLSAFGLGSYNPFIWNNSGRGYEIHLPGKTPTSLANLSVYGTLNDNSNVAAARYYVTSSGLPWAMTIPAKPFNYLIEGKVITSGYLRFQNWAESGGAQFMDWYSNTGSGYRDNSKLYNP
jgi:LruC domain-containing protein